MAASSTDQNFALEDDPKRQWDIDHMGRVDRISFLAVMFAFMAAPTIACILRIGFRVKARNKLSWDDGFVLLATTFLIAATVCYYRITDVFYLTEAITINPAMELTASEIEALSGQGPTILLNSGRCLLLGTNFAIKASFLAVFRPLLRHVSLRLDFYFYFSVVYTALAFAFAIAMPWMLCPTNMGEQYHCLQRKQYLYLGLLCFFDISTDVLIVSIPILLLQFARLSLLQKVRIAFFLCLSCAMIIICAFRTASSLHHPVDGKQQANIIYTNLLLQVESGVAVLMGSLSALRAVFAGTQGAEGASSLYTFCRNLLSKIGISRKHISSTNDDSTIAVHPGITPQPVTNTSMKSLKRFIRRIDREPGQTTIDSMPDSTVNPITDYHDFIYSTHGRN